MRILITGNLGYVGPVLAAQLRSRWPGCCLIGFDAGWFDGHRADAAALAPERHLDRQHRGDVREIAVDVLHGIDAVVHLAAVSHDPIGQRFAAQTDAINHMATLRLAALAAAAGVRRFVFASSCSVYGEGGGGAMREADPAAPLTAYARSKLAAEQGLRGLASDAMAVTCLRFATACGMSRHLRLDLVLNDFVASAVAAGRIDVLSNGRAWRPLIDVQDMAAAIAWAVERVPEQGGRYLVVNAGCDAGNRRIAALARMVANRLPGQKLSIARNAPPDRRSYRVDFRLFRELAPAHQPNVALEQSVDGLAAGLHAIGFTDPDFRRSSAMIRLQTLAALVGTGALTESLRWAG